MNSSSQSNSQTNIFCQMSYNTGNSSQSTGFPNNSQLEPSTQVYDESANNHMVNGSGYDCYSQDSMIDRPLFPSPWARLTSRAKGGKSYELYMKPEQEDAGYRYNIHTIGRAKKCDVTVSSSGYSTTNVSNQHCRVYCKINYAISGEQPPRHAENGLEPMKTNSMHIYDTLVEYLQSLEVWIDDLSTNGTFVNGHPMAKKGSRLLHHGDMINLINPDIDPKTLLSNKGISKPDLKSAVKAVQDEILGNSFDIMIFLPSAQSKKPTGGIGIAASSSSSSKLAQSALSHEVTVNVGYRSDPLLYGDDEMHNDEHQHHNELRKSTTVMRLLNQERNYSDYYQTGEQIGVGGAAKVFQAINKETGIAYAVKVMDYRHFTSNRPSVANAIAAYGQQANLAAILKEAELLRALRHPRIIQLEDIFADDRYLYLVMELSRGGDLFERITKKTRYSECEAREVMRQVLEAIMFLHDNKIAHRDLKPENILLVSLSNDIDIKLTDFGLAKEVDEAGGLKSYCGTPQYFSPEVLQRKFTVAGQGAYSLEADMWSVGVILYVLLSGAYPFREDTLFHQIQVAEYSFTQAIWQTISADAKDVIRSLIVVDPKQRLLAAHALQHPWFTASSSSLLQATYSIGSSTTTASIDDMSVFTEKILPMLPPVGRLGSKRNNRRNVNPTASPPSTHINDIDDNSNDETSPRYRTRSTSIPSPSSNSNSYSPPSDSILVSPKKRVKVQPAHSKRINNTKAKRKI